jgi:uncharacterized protein (UPF0276 family)
LSRAETLARIKATIAGLQKVSGREILIENLDYGPTGARAYICEPDFIRTVCADAGCGMIWDIAHAENSAGPMHLSEEAYLNALLKKLAPFIREVHLNSPQNGRDAHQPVTSRELNWLKSGLTQGIKPYFLVLERAWGDLTGFEFAQTLLPEVEMLSTFVRNLSRNRAETRASP